MDTDVFEQTNILNRKFLTLSNLVAQEKRKYFHLNTVENFISHFEKINNVDDRTWVVKVLSNYFDESFSIISSVDSEISKVIYKTYLEKLAKYYDEYLGFTMYIYLWFVVSMYVILMIIIWWLTNLYLGFFLLY